MSDAYNHIRQLVTAIAVGSTISQINTSSFMVLDYLD